MQLTLVTVTCSTAYMLVIPAVLLAISAPSHGYSQVFAVTQHVPSPTHDIPHGSEVRIVGWADRPELNEAIASVIGKKCDAQGHVHVHLHQPFGSRSPMVWLWVPRDNLEVGIGGPWAVGTDGVTRPCSALEAMGLAVVREDSDGSVGTLCGSSVR